MVTIENWEEYAILRADGELDAAGIAALEAFLAKHPSLREEARLYDAVKLEPDENIVFAAKDALLKPEPRVISLNRRRMLAAAAGLALLVGALAVLRSGEEGSGATGATIAGSVKIERPAAPVIDPQPAWPQTRRAEGLQEARHPAFAKKTFPDVVPSSSQPAPQPAEPMIAEGNLPALPAREAQFLAVAVEEHRTPGLIEAPASGIPASPVMAAAPQAADRLLDRLPFDDDKLQLVAGLRNAASERITALRTTRDKLRDSDVTVQVGRRDLFTLHF